MSTEEVAAWLTLQFRRLVAGELEPGVATASATVAKAVVELGRAALVEERLGEVERALGLAAGRPA